MFMDKRTEQAFAYLEKNEHSMMELLKNLVSIETPSVDREANERIAAHLDTWAYGYSSCGWKVRPGTVSCEG